MIHTLKTIRTTIFAVVAIALLVRAAHVPNVAASEPKTDRGIISGDLASVDWKSMVGKEVTIKGDLVVVDTFNLARRGQVTVARDRLYVCLLYTSPSPRDRTRSRMPSSA